MMKPDISVCKYCEKGLEGKRSYCDDAHRMAYRRQTEQKSEQTRTKSQPEQLNPNKTPVLPEQPEQPDPSKGAENHGKIQNDNNPNKANKILEKYGVDRSKLTKTDKTFFDRAMRVFNQPYYNFTSPLKKAKCVICNKEYQTNLSLNRFCSYQHYDQAHTIFVRKKQLTK